MSEVTALREALVWIELTALKGGPVPDLVLDSIKRCATAALSCSPAPAPAPAPDPAEAMRAALDAMLRAVCGESGFAAAVRAATGLAYPWPALDLAEEQARAALKGNGEFGEAGETRQ